MGEKIILQLLQKVVVSIRRALAGRFYGLDDAGEFFIKKIVRTSQSHHSTFQVVIQLPVLPKST